MLWSLQQKLAAAEVAARKPNGDTSGHQAEKAALEEKIVALETNAAALEKEKSELSEKLGANADEVSVKAQD